MIELLPAQAAHVVALRASGRVTVDDLQQAIDAIEDLKRTHPRISFYAEIDDMRWMTVTALLRDLGYGLTQLGDLQHYHRAAVVTSRRWLRHLARVENHLFKPLEVRVFAPQDRSLAQEWVSQLPERPTPAAQAASR